jgi:hypothetical protein
MTSFMALTYFWGGAFLIWALVLFGTALSITFVSARVRRYGVKTTGRVTNAKHKSVYRKRYQPWHEADGIWRATYVYTYEGQKLIGTQDLSEDTPVPLFQYGRDIEVLYLPHKPRISRIAADDYTIRWRYSWGVGLLLIGLMIIGVGLFAPR